MPALRRRPSFPVARPAVPPDVPLFHLRSRQSLQAALPAHDLRKWRWMSEKITKSDDEWRNQLTPDQYAVTRCHATEPPFSGAYYDRHDPGTYRCICCHEPL